MSQQAVEIILTRQLASYLAMPIFVVDPAGRLLYYNERAEAILGHRYDETGEMPLEEWSTMWMPTAEDGSPIPLDELPLVIALRKNQAVHRAFRIRGLDGVSRRIAVTALPLEGQGGRHLGALAIFWEQDEA
ncbi:MAG TPA: PAS domain-containing protein [Methylomirabilota bacterium]|jgi:PAS domain-containing protein|nr:PAS domain-containing protein [Methylomirabilota bacterium]